MYRTSNFASIRFRLAGVLLSLFLLSVFGVTLMVTRLPEIVNAASHVRAEYSVSNISASALPQSDKPHTMAATYYSFQGNLKASINLNNKGLVPLEVTPTLFNLAGERLEVPAVTIDATTFQVFDLADWAGPGGPTFQQGSLQLFYRGRDMLLGAQIKIVDSASSVIFDEQLGEPGAMFSSRLDGLWWLPDHDSQVSLAVSNTTDSIVEASLVRDSKDPKQNGSKELILQPHQTVLIDPALDSFDRPAVMQETGGLSIKHSGTPGALIARAMIQNPLIGFSSTVQFADPGKARSSRLHGAGLRLGEIAGEDLTPMLVARNISNETAVLHGRIRYIKKDGGEAVTALREVKLRAGEVKAWQLNEINKQSAGAESAGLEIDYSTQPGSVVVSALSVSRSGNQVFQVPMLDVSAQKSSTGAYPFYMYGTSSTVVYIKNTTAVEQKYIAHLNYEGGNYRMGLKNITPGETVMIDIRALRDKQILDDEDHTIPLGVGHGQVRWTLIQSEGTDPLALIGRAEQVDEVKGISSTYACQNCCGDFFEGSYISPSSVELQVGGTATLHAFELHGDCYGYTYPMEQTGSWNSSNPSVASVSGGQVTCIGAGQTTITATWTSYTSVPTQCGGSGFNPGPVGGCCGSATFFRSASATAEGVATPHHVRVLVDQAGFPADCPDSGLWVRQIKVQVVDINNNDITSGSVKESYSNLSANTCNNGTPSPSPCEPLDTGGQFLDSMGVSGNLCNSGIARNSGCGFTLTSTWSMCNGTVQNNIWKSTRETRSNTVKVNGQVNAFPPGTQLFP